MIYLSEPFLNNVINYTYKLDNDYEQNFTLFSSISQIFNYYYSNLKQEKVFESSENNKIDFCSEIVKLRLDHLNNFDTQIFNEVFSNGKFKNFIIYFKKDEINDSYSDYTNASKFLFEEVLNKLKLVKVLENHSDIKDVLTKIEREEFTNYNNIIDEWEKQISKSYKYIKDYEKLESISSVTSLDLSKDDYGPVLNKYRENFNENSVLKTHFTSIDNSLPHHGFEKGRLYIIAGESGVGKSIILQNILINNIKNSKPNTSGKKKVHIFITAENLIDESILRFYSSFSGIPYTTLVEKIKTDTSFNFKHEIKNLLDKIDTNVLFYYVPARLTTISEIENIVDIHHKEYDIKGIYLDYMDLISSGENLEIRHDLASVTLSLKRMSILYNSPVVTLTQLNRGGYGGISTSLTNISESMGKVNDADFVAVLQNIKEEENVIFTDMNGDTIGGKFVRFTILKNRNGNSPINSKLYLRKEKNSENVFNFTFEDDTSNFSKFRNSPDVDSNNIEMMFESESADEDYNFFN